jgi:DNA-binding transcriptional MerR regulator
MRPNKRQAARETGSRSINPGGNLTLKIGEVAKLAGVGVETLRFYERSGLLDQPARTEGGYRLYDAESLKKLEFIRRAQTLGFTLEEIKRIIGESRAGQSPCAEVREIVRRRLAELDRRMRQMRLYRNALAGALKQWDEVGAAEGEFCGLIENAKIDIVNPEQGKLKRRKK